MLELIPSFVTILFGVGALGLALRDYMRREQGLIIGAFALHLVAALAQVFITRDVYGYGDMLTYFHESAFVADRMREDFLAYAPDALRLLFQQQTTHFAWLDESSPATATMYGLSAWLHYLTQGSLYATCLLIAIGAFFGKLAMYRAFRPLFPSHLHQRMIAGMMWMPSIVFWSSGLLKESVAMIGLGLATYGIIRLADSTSSTPRAALAIGAGSVIVGLVKTYILGPFAIAAGAWYYWQRGLRLSGGQALSLRPLHFALAMALAMTAIIGLGALFPRYALTNLVDEASRLQEVGQSISGGSNFALSDTAPTSSSGQLAMAPLAVITALARPFLFEANNIMALVSALEMTFILGLVFLALYRRGGRECWQVIMRSPPLVFALIFVVLFALGVGLTTTNMGTLARYRMPMLPFYMMLLFALLPARAPRQPVRLRRQRLNARRESPLPGPHRS
ncbi:hypothetical protein EA187_09125 [Lujinxingia sediminis]|uniref:Glycosyltransferase RgtA/B/C/D-like domain-containing protein n=1 Tax=Lujinxingia sediminis TaxID=2480984 RepID=A0ABY0CUR5_9DELT|nr:hypothetical protein [Lujinxingia sediminis]RVU45909.1 hypothetical protein EA187_09125 [Lujinxingia sediminis]